MIPTNRRCAALVGGLVATSLSLGACASDPAGAQVMKPAADYASAQSLAGEGGQWPADAWWTRFGDAQLTALIEEGLADSPTMAAAQARVRQADALRAQARSAQFPQIGGQFMANGAVVDTGDLIPNGGPSGIQTAGVGILQATYDFDIWGRNRAALAAATGEAEAARADAAEARLVLSTAIASAYADLAQAQARLDAANEAVTVRRRTHELMSARRDNGLENAGSVSQAEAGQSAAQAEAEAANEVLGLTRNRIAALMGAGPDRGLAITKPMVTAGDLALPDAIQANLVGRRPDIVAARLRAEAAASRVSQARTGYYPNLDLSAFAGGLIPGLLSGGSPILFAAAGPAVSLPIFGGGKVESQVRQREAEYDAAVADYNKAVTQAFQDVADVAVSARALDARLEHSRDALAASRNAYRVAGERFEGGLSSLLDVLRTEDTLIANRRAVAEMETRAFQLNVAMIRALGGGYVEESSQ